MAVVFVCASNLPCLVPSRERILSFLTRCLLPKPFPHSADKAQLTQEVQRRVPAKIKSISNTKLE